MNERKVANLQEAQPEVGFPQSLLTITFLTDKPLGKDSLYKVNELTQSEGHVMIRWRLLMMF